MQTWLCGALFLLAVIPASARDFGGYYTAERVASARANCEKYPWAQAIRARAVGAAEPYLKMSDDQLWALIPSQDLPRCADATFTYGGKTGSSRPGCLVCGDKIFSYGNYPYTADHFSRPWKVVCPSCGTVFPTNDFGAYYRSGINEHGLFDPTRADRKLLFNAEHPDPNDPLHLWGVDDGFGYTDKNGANYHWIGYYSWKALWPAIYEGLGALSEAYLYTGKPEYAHKCAVLLDRLADVYPSMDWKPYADRGWMHSDGGSHKGKIEGAIWETFRVQSFAAAYDRIISGLKDQPELYAFLAAKAKQYQLAPKGTRELLMQNIDDGILRCGAKAIIDRRIQGNQGMHQAAMAQLAVALDTQPDTNAWLDWIFSPDGSGIPGTLVGSIDRDGVGAEAAPGYALSWGANIGQVADILADYGKYAAHDIYRDFPQFKKTFLAGYHITCLDWTTPNIGDSGSCGAVGGKVQCDPEFIARGFRYLKDPEIALAAYKNNGNTGIGLCRRVIDQDPEALGAEIDRIGKAAGAQSAQGPHNMTGYGFVTLEQGQGKTGTALWMYYGRNGGHGHPDRLNFDLIADGFDLLPDNGYPEFAAVWPHRYEWSDQTIAHNCVLVDKTGQKVTWVGTPRFFKALPGFQAVEISSPDVYPQTKEYSRTLALVDVGEGKAYAVDISRVLGGRDHIYNLHGPGAACTTEGLTIVPQAKGTYAGESTPFGPCGKSGLEAGYSWLYDVARVTKPADHWQVDWKLEPGYHGATAADNVHIRLHHFSAEDDVALASGDPPQNKKGNPRRLRYVLAHRDGASLPAGQSLASTFVSLLEPYRDSPLITAAERIALPAETSGLEPVALKVTLADGSIDYILYSGEGRQLQVPGGPSFRARMAFLRVTNGAVQRAAVIGGTALSLGQFGVSCTDAGYSGKIVKMDKGLTGGRIWVDAKLPTDGSLNGQEINVANDGARNACYRIREVRRDGDGTLVDLGDVSFVRQYKDTNDYGAGFAYEFSEGAAFTIPNHISVQRLRDNLYDVRMMGATGLELAR